MTSSIDQAFQALPHDLRSELVSEFKSIQANFFARHWSPTELAGGRFCEIVYSVIRGHADGNYPARASKPRNFLAACQSLEHETQLPRSFRILIPRMLPALYEVRNNRGVGHVGGDVDPNYMDSTFVLSTASWVMGELVRVLHSVDLSNAQEIISNLSAHKAPSVWVSSKVRRVLNPSLKLKDQIILLVGSLDRKASLDELCQWLEHQNRAYVKRTLNTMHKEKLLEFSENTVELLPPGQALLQTVLSRESKI